MYCYGFCVFKQLTLISRHWNIFQRTGSKACMCSDKFSFLFVSQQTVLILKATLCLPDIPNWLVRLNGLRKSLSHSLSPGTQTSPNYRRHNSRIFRSCFRWSLRGAPRPILRNESGLKLSHEIAKISSHLPYFWNHFGEMRLPLETIVTLSIPRSSLQNWTHLPTKLPLFTINGSPPAVCMGWKLFRLLVCPIFTFPVRLWTCEVYFLHPSIPKHLQAAFGFFDREHKT